MHVCMYACMHVCIHTHIHTYTPRISLRILVKGCAGFVEFAGFAGVAGLDTEKCDCAIAIVVATWGVCGRGGLEVVAEGGRMKCVWEGGTGLKLS